MVIGLFMAYLSLPIYGFPRLHKGYLGFLAFVGIPKNYLGVLGPI
jgi:hypothetical protein